MRWWRTNASWLLSTAIWMGASLVIRSHSTALWGEHAGGLAMTICILLSWAVYTLREGMNR